jgi:hypothetical protein
MPESPCGFPMGELPRLLVHRLATCPVGGAYIRATRPERENASNPLWIEGSRVRHASPVIRPLTQEVSMKARPLRSRRAKFENLALTWLSLMIGPGLALALSWFGLG